jgi:hypothetical protein
MNELLDSVIVVEVDALNDKLVVIINKIYADLE